MNYLEFYNNAKRRITEALLSMWAPGQEEIQKYFRQVLEEEPLLSEPVFQGTFPWKSHDLEFGKLTENGLLEKGFVEALDRVKNEDYRFPINRKPYSHQVESWQKLLQEEKSIVVTSGTGSGKTECFMIPVLQDLLQQKRSGNSSGVQAIFLYPLNALMNSQQKRMKAWCEALDPQINFAIYNGKTPETVAKQKQNQAYPELLSRREIRNNPPQILFTNPTMLEYMLVRQADYPILAESKGKLRWILLDETHTYSGSSAAELAMQIRRLLDAFGVSADEVRFSATSATITGDDHARLKKFISQITGKREEDIAVIGGKRQIPKDTDRAKPEIIKLRSDLMDKPVLSATEIGRRFKKDATIEESLKIIQEIGDAYKIPTRGHFFIRSIGGVFVCTNPECKRHKEIRPAIGSFTTKTSTNCPECGSYLLELIFCKSCGNQLISGEVKVGSHYPYAFRLPVNQKDDLFELEEERITEEAGGDEQQEQPSQAWRELILGWNIQSKPSNSCTLFPTRIDAKTSEIYGQGNYSECIHHNGNIICPHCGSSKDEMAYHRTSNEMLSRLLSASLLEQAEPMKNTNNALWDGRKYIAFTDNRQGTSRSALAQNTETERATARTLVFHYLSNQRRNRFRARRHLTQEEEEQYRRLLPLRGKGISAVEQEIVKYEEILNGTEHPLNVGVSLIEMANHIASDSKIEPLFRHLTYKNQNERDLYAKALLIDQFGRRPRRVLSPETMGFVKVKYPLLTSSQMPMVFANQRFTKSDWQDFLKICLDFFVRDNTHIDVYPYRKYITQKYFASSLYGPDCDLRVDDKGRRLKKWPQVIVNNDGKAREKQGRLILLLCAGIGITDVDELDSDKIGIINDILKRAWHALIGCGILRTTDSTHQNPNNHGYKLDLFFPQSVELELLDHAWICPVTNVSMDTTFRGYSPSMIGNIKLENFQRYKANRDVHYPFYPYANLQKKNGDSILEPVTHKEVLDWVEKHLREHKRIGLWSNMHERILLNYPVFIAAEHSAQQHKDTLIQIEEKFNTGGLNILSCSTTMEMGVDIGGISEVVMNNVPPKPANYLQRAGRAGRRNEIRALALTLCSSNPIGAMAYDNPKWAMTHPTAMTVVKLESGSLIQRHINAFLFANYVQTKLGISVKSEIGLFYYPDTHEPQSLIFNYSGFKAFLAEILSNQHPNLTSNYEKLVRRTFMESTTIYQAVNKCLSNIDKIFLLFDERKKLLEDTKKNLIGQAGYTENSPEIKAINYQLNQMFGQNLIGYLAENDFIPSAGIPTGVVDFNIHTYLDNNQVNESTENTFYKNDPSFHITRALAEYAPGNQIVVNESCYLSAGIMMQSEWNDAKHLILQNCRSCGYSSLIYQPMQSCPICGGDSFVGTDTVGGSFIKVIEPAGFSVDYFEPPTRIIDKSKIRQSFIEPILLNVQPWSLGESTNLYDIRSSQPNAEILYYNKGYGYGFSVCVKCGRAEKEMCSATDNAFGTSPLLNHKRLFGGRKENDGICDGNSNYESGVKRNVLLGGRFQTDYVEIRFRDTNSLYTNNVSILRSLGVILSLKLAEYLGINREEISFDIKHYRGYSSVYIFDTAKGGAGYSLRFIDYAEEIFDNAFNSLSSCKCPKACDKCLIDRTSQWYINDLDRHLAIKWLEHERRNRIDVPLNVKTAFSNAKKITSDLNTAVIRFLDTVNTTKALFFVSGAIKNWAVNGWPFLEYVKRLQNEGKKIEFAFNEPNMENLNARQIQELFEAKGFFGLNVISNNPILTFKPMVQVEFSDGTTKLLFCEDFDDSFSYDWGKTDKPVYQSVADSRIQVSEWNINFDGLISNDQILFEFKIKDKKARLKEFYTLLTSQKHDRWAKIEDRIRNKEVAINYMDTYLVDPLGVLMINNLIKSLTEKLNIKVKALIFDISAYSNFGQNSIGRIIDDFVSKDQRRKFMTECSDELLSIFPVIQEEGRLPHWRELLVEGDDFELVIRPNGGIRNGWTLDQSEQIIDYDDIHYDDDLLLHNQSSFNGILYNIIFQTKN